MLLLSCTNLARGYGATPLFEDGCAPQFCYIDDIGSWATNEITLNWNAPMSWASSFVADLDRGDDGGRRGRDRS